MKNIITKILKISNRRFKEKPAHEKTGLGKSIETTLKLRKKKSGKERKKASKNVDSVKNISVHETEISEGGDRDNEAGECLKS